MAARRTRRRRSRGATQRKLAGYEVTGNAADKFVRPERTMDFRRPFRTDFAWTMNQTLRVWLISSCPCGTKPARRRKRQPGHRAPHSKLVATDVNPLILIPARENEWEPTHVGLLLRVVDGRGQLSRPALRGQLAFAHSAPAPRRCSWR